MGFLDSDVPRKRLRLDQAEKKADFLAVIEHWLDTQQ